MLHTVQGHKRCALGHRANDYLLALDHVGIEAMERSAVGHHHVVGDIHDIVDGTDAYHAQAVLQPFGALLHLAVLQAHGCVAGASLLVLHADADGEVLVIYLEVLHRGAVQAGLIAVLHQPCIQVTCHAIMAARICTVGGDIHFDYEIALDMVVLGCGDAHGSVFGQHDDAVVVVAHAYLVLCTNHAVALHTAQLALLDGEALVAVVELGAHHGHYHLLSGSHIRCSAHYLDGLALACIHAADVHVVAVGVRLTCEHVCCPQAFQSALDRLHFFHTIHFQAHACECIGHLIGIEGGVNILAQPFVRYIHITLYIIFVLTYFEVQNYDFSLRRGRKMLTECPLPLLIIRQRASQRARSGIRNPLGQAACHMINVWKTAR